jgi:hypothetical protein
LIIYIDNLRICRDVNWSVSATPRDIARETSDLVDNREDQILKFAELFVRNSAEAQREYISNPLRQTRQGWINLLPQSKTQFKKARKVQRLTESWRLVEVDRHHRLANIREMIVENLCKEWRFLIDSIGKLSRAVHKYLYF